MLPLAEQLASRKWSNRREVQICPVAPWWVTSPDGRAGGLCFVVVAGRAPYSPSGHRRDRPAGSCARKLAPQDLPPCTRWAGRHLECPLAPYWGVRGGGGERRKVCFAQSRVGCHRGLLVHPIGADCQKAAYFRRGCLLAAAGPLGGGEEKGPYRSPEVNVAV